MLFYSTSLLSLHTARHAQARANGRKHGDEYLNHDFPNFTFVHSGKGFKVQGSNFKRSEDDVFIF